MFFKLVALYPSECTAGFISAT